MEVLLCLMTRKNIIATKKIVIAKTVKPANAEKLQNAMKKFGIL